MPKHSPPPRSNLGSALVLAQESTAEVADGHHLGEDEATEQQPDDHHDLLAIDDEATREVSVDQGADEGNAGNRQADAASVDHPLVEAHLLGVDVTDDSCLKPGKADDDQ